MFARLSMKFPVIHDLRYRLEFNQKVILVCLLLLNFKASTEEDEEIGEISLSDHKPKKIILELNKPKNRKILTRKKSPRINWEKLRDEETTARYRDRVELLIEEKERNERNKR